MVFDLPSQSHTSESRPLWQADVYLEGSDQHRGWFQSSLLLSLAGNRYAPFKTVLTHGFMVDADREKISKSKQGQGGYEKPQTADAYVKKYGADIVRLWVASQDYRNDIVVSDERIARVSETYRYLRNTLRYQLSNLYDFEPAKDIVSDDALTELDRWVLAAFSELEQDVMVAYDAYEFHVVYQKITQFAAVELSAKYHDRVKDRLYTRGKDLRERRATQTTLFRMVQSLCQMLSPILAFTADEAWEFIPNVIGSVHLSDWKPVRFELEADEKKRWDDYWFLDQLAKVKLETLRQQKTIGKDLDAKITFIFPQNALLPFDGPQVAIPDQRYIASSDNGNHSFSSTTFRHIAANLENIREVLNVSAVKAIFSTDNSATQKVEVIAEHADGEKCERCWHFETTIGASKEHPTLCHRCVDAVSQSGK
jgi:isoleucyl-tRNA synthetase